MKSDSLVRIYRSLYGRFGPQRWWPADSPFEVMVGAVLTQSTSWKNVEKAVANLKKAGALSPEKLDAISTARLARLIRPAGYFNVKAKRLKSLISFLRRQYGYDIGRMRRNRKDTLRELLLGVHGIGPETCDSILLYALRKPIFVIDAYTKRIFSRCGISDPRASYGELQEMFTAGVPRSEKVYNEYHALIVKLGKDICRKKPKCGLCPIEKMCYNTTKRRRDG